MEEQAVVFDLFTWAFDLVSSGVTIGFDWVKNIFDAASPAMGVSLIFICCTLMTILRFIIKPIFGATVKPEKTKKNKKNGG